MEYEKRYCAFIRVHISRTWFKFPFNAKPIRRSYQGKTTFIPIIYKAVPHPADMRSKMSTSVVLHNIKCNFYDISDFTIFPGTDIYKTNTDNVTFREIKDRERHHLSEHFLQRFIYLFIFF